MEENRQIIFGEWLKKRAAFVGISGDCELAAALRISIARLKTLAKLRLSFGKLKGRLSLRLARVLQTDQRMTLHGYLITAPEEAPTIRPLTKIQRLALRTESRRRSKIHREMRRRIGEGNQKNAVKTV